MPFSSGLGAHDQRIIYAQDFQSPDLLGGEPDESDFAPDALRLSYLIRANTIAQARAQLPAYGEAAPHNEYTQGGQWWVRQKRLHPAGAHGLYKAELNCIGFSSGSAPSGYKVRLHAGSQVLTVTVDEEKQHRLSGRTPLPGYSMLYFHIGPLPVPTSQGQGHTSNPLDLTDPPNLWNLTPEDGRTEHVPYGWIHESRSTEPLIVLGDGTLWQVEDTWFYQERYTP